MTLSIADQLQKRLKEKKLSIREVERLADLKMNAVRNIIRGVVKQPNAQTLKTIANVLDCSVDDLLQTEDSAFSPLILENETGLTAPLDDFELFERASEVVIRITKEKGYKISVGQALNLIRGIYSFSNKKKEKSIDMDFVEWLFEGIIKS
ncbi:MAG TPA: helix-turn-helix transcriptional regulator [Alphaproteobacteria bacterium]|nr:helix-turn-helix transcriptional regulator [Alphaproteobacteria bacterium]